MEYIDKRKNKLKAHQIINQFLNHQWRPQEAHYSSIDFRKRAFSEHLKPKFKQLMLEEQNHLCCYCMRRIDRDEKTTLEHIIPYTTHTHEGIKPYLSYDIIRDNVVLQHDFEEVNFRPSTPPFPHTIAYENIVASCDGKFHDGMSNEQSGKTCNLKRLNEDIDPVFYIFDIKDKIEYTKGGLVISKDNEYSQTLKILNLNYITLQHIRLLWSRIAQHLPTDLYHEMDELSEQDDLKMANRRHKILLICLIDLNNIKQSHLLIAKFKTQSFWNILMQYKWFYNYYKQKCLQ